MNIEFDSFVEDVLGEKAPRPLLIVGSSKVDDLLKLILNKYFLPKPQRDEDLLEGDRPLATFSSRIKISYRLGIIDIEFFKALEQLRAIRNKSAHGIEFDIKKNPIKDHISNLSAILVKRESYILTKARYFDDGNGSSNIRDLQCCVITLCVILQAILVKIEETKGVSETLKISKK